MRFHRSYLDPAVITGKHGDQRVARPVPANLRQVRQLAIGQVDVDAGAVERDEQQADLRVGRPGERIALAVGLGRRVRGVAEPPGPDVVLADPRGQQPRPVRTPPVPVVAVHLLGRAKLGGAKADFRVFIDQFKNRPTVQADDPQRSVSQVGGRGAIRAQPGIDAGPGSRDLPGGDGRHVADEQAAGERERREPPVRAGRVGHDAARGLAHPLAAPQFGRWNPLGAPGQQLERVRQQLLFAGGEAERPQPGDRVVGGGRS